MATLLVMYSTDIEKNMLLQEWILEHQRKLDMLIEERKKGQGASGSENLLF